MERYRNSSGNSGVYGIETANDYIRVQFSSGQTYRYSYNGKAGTNHVENMKSLARSGSGLNTYIRNKTYDLYDK